MKLLMRLLGWKHLSGRRRARLQGFKDTVKKCLMFIGAAALTYIPIAVGLHPVVVVSWAALAGMVAWLWYHMNKEWGM